MPQGVIHFFETDRLLSSVGEVDGATISFYLTGTTTLATIYADQALTTPLLNPVVVSVGGVLPKIYLDPAITYRRVIVYSYDGSVVDRDPIYPHSYATDSGAGEIGYSSENVYASGTVGDKLNDILSIKDSLFGAVGDNVVDDAAAFQTAINYGGKIFIPKGTYRFKSRANCVLTKNTELLFDPDAVVVLDTTINSQALTVDGVNLYSLRVSGGVFNAAAVANPGVGGNVGSVWDLNNLKAGRFSDSSYVAGDSFLDVKGDTAISAVNCHFLVITTNRFSGWYDNAVYLTGGNITPGQEDDGGPSIITDNYFEYNGTAISLKRRNRHCIIVGNFFGRNYVDIGCYEVGAGEIQPGDRLTVSSNEFIGTVSRVFEPKGYGEYTFSNNTVRDWGYDLSEVAIAQPNAIIASGNRNSIISGNIFEMRDRLSTVAHVAILRQNITIDAVLYTSTNLSIDGNICKNSQYFIFEAAGVGPCYALNNNCSVGVVTPASFTNASSHFSGFVASGDWRHFIGTVEVERKTATWTGFKDAVRVNDVQVVGARNTGWTAMTGTASKGGFATGSVTLPQLAQVVKGLTDALTTHGLIGA